MFLLITTAVSIVQDLNSFMEVWEMFMHKDSALADLNLPHTMVHYQPLVKPLKKEGGNRLKNGLKEANTASAFRAINSEIFSIMKSCGEVIFFLKIQATTIFFTPDLAFFHHHCLVNHHLLHLLLVNLHPHHHPCCSSSQRNDQNQTCPHLNHLPSLSNY